jgi:hypothetical protein
VAVTTVAERGDLTRFEHPRQLMRYLGFPPSEYSSGARRRQGSLTKAGNSHARRALIEGAWAYRSPSQGQSASPIAPGTGAQAHPGQALERAGPPVQTLSATARPRETRQPGRGRHRPRTACVYVGHCPRGPADTIAPDR